MKKNKILAWIIISIITFSNLISVNANSGDTVSTWIKTLVTEKTPWYNCVCAREAQGEWEKKVSINGYVEDKVFDWKDCSNNEITKRKYICTVPEWFAGIQSSFQQIIRWVVQIAILLGVVAIAALGIAWSVAGDWDPAYKKFLKEWLTGLIIGLLILFFFRYILLWVAPWIFTA